MHGHHLLHFGTSHLRGCGIGDVLISKVETIPSPVLPSDALKRLQELKPKSMRDPKRPNIKFSL